MPAAPDEVIVAPATPPGRSAIALIRLSGPGSDTLALRFLPGQAVLKPRLSSLAAFQDPSGETLDQVLVTWFPRPHSYTGEDVVEISCHGSPVVVARILQCVLDCGARAAEPGEFTLRAFLNGRLDLAQAEAVRDLVESQTVFQAKVAVEQVQGRLARTLLPLKEELIKVASHLETSLEFVEDEVHPDTAAQLVMRLRCVDEVLEKVESSFEVGRLVNQGAEIVIIGRPNVGKSSIFNKLLDEDRAIVTALPGTTRDALAETLDIGGLAVRLVDTAGIRDADDLVEQLGVKKSREYLERADLLVWVVDAGQGFGPEDQRIWSLLEALPFVLIENKADLPIRLEVPPGIAAASRGCCRVSAQTGEGLEELKQTVMKALIPGGGLERESVLLTNERQRDCVRRARASLGAAQEGLAKGLSEEFPAYDLRRALDELGRLTGETGIEDILTEIFSTFCIGK